MIILLSRYITSELLWTRYDGARIKIRKTLLLCFPLNPSYPQNYPRDVISWERIITNDRLRCSSTKGGKERYFQLDRRGEVNAYILYDLLSHFDKIRYGSPSYESFSFVSGNKKTKTLLLCFPLNPSYPRNYPCYVISWERIIKTDKLRCSSTEGRKERHFQLDRRGEVNAYILYDLLINYDKIRYAPHSYERFLSFPVTPPLCGLQHVSNCSSFKM